MDIQQRIEQLIQERNDFAKENLLFRQKITEVVTQRLDDICWRDVYIELAALVGIEFDPDLLPRDQMLANCERFIDSVKTKTPYKPVYFPDEECKITEKELKE